MPEGITIDELYEATRESLALTLVAGSEGLDRIVTVPRIQKPGLALAGFLPQVHPDRVQVLGKTELAYLVTLGNATARERVRALARAGVAALIVTRGAEPPPFLREEADRACVPLFGSHLPSSRLIRGVTAALERLLAPRTQIHGALLEVFRLGALLVGPSGIGKSEGALDLVSRGHRLVADDVVVVRREASGELVGEPPAILGRHLEIRGLGIVDVEALFGMFATLSDARIDLVVELVEWGGAQAIDRLGLDDDRFELLGVELPRVRIPVRPGRPIAALVEAAVRNEVLKRGGRHAARELVARVDEALAVRPGVRRGT